jgi:hypothetical protein
MRRTPALRTLAAALFTGGILTAAAVGTPAAAAPSAHTNGGGGSNSPVWGTVVSRGDLNLRLQPTWNSPVVGRLSPGAQDRVECAATGQRVFGNSDWYWLVGAHAWASAAFVDTGRQWVPSCSDPCPDSNDGYWNNSNGNDNSGWNGGSGGSNSSHRNENNSSWNNDDSSWNSDPCNDPGWSSSGSGTWSFSVSGSWSWSLTGSSSSSWDWVPGGR